MTSMMSGKKRKKPRMMTSILTTVPNSDVCVRNTFFHRLVETPSTTATTSGNGIKSSLPSSSSVRFLVQQKQKQAISRFGDHKDFDLDIEEIDDHKRRLAQRKKRFESEKRVTRPVTTSTDPQPKPDAMVDPLYRSLSSSRTSKIVNGTNASSIAAAGDASPPALVGRNANLEKPYLRLTTFPDPDHVRPLPVLVKALAHIKNTYLTEEDFEWANEQLKSVRQDLTVQRIRNPFVLEVYETHARMLLEHGDLNEFNQCQTVIRALCGRGETGNNGTNPVTEATTKPLQQSKESADEFGGYALLYALVRNSWLELNQTLVQQQEQQHERANNKQEYEAVQSSSYQHALCVVRAVLEDDTVAFFRLYAVAPHMSPYLMDFLVNRVRKAAYLRAIASYRPNVGTEQFREWLRFDDLEQTRQFLKQQGAVFLNVSDTAAFWVDCKASFTKLNRDDKTNKRLKRSIDKAQTSNYSSSTISSSSEDTE
ncbi:hypothetical protein ACA910_002898 [Epithemia clementina (nom. ined.)]